MNKPAIERFLASAAQSAKDPKKVKAAWLLVMGKPYPQKSTGAISPR